MTLPTVRQLFLLCLLGIFGCLSTTDASVFGQRRDDTALRTVRGIQSNDMSNVLWKDQNEEQVQNVFKRFLFHYSKALNSVGAVKESHSVHPLMRLLPKLSQRRKKKVLLLKIRDLPEGTL
ncbi:neuromedin-U [Girardinichthys multiradiatus]|uniref:neuromedin-U n=1 Tax=Girardinichthys multiradiatus TaxID=208333 RepID=UPI001FADCC9D|nr:neuromedin-U [Girardinichthys multiradiatus]